MNFRVAISLGAEQRFGTRLFAMREFLDKLDVFCRKLGVDFSKNPLFLWSGLLILAAGIVLGGVIAANTVNLGKTKKDREKGDQEAYIRFAEDLRESDFTYVGDRNRMPLYPGLQALFFAEGTSREDIFQRGKMVNIGLTLVGLGLLALAFRPFVTPWGLFLFVGGMAMGLYLPKAGYFQAEITYYTLFTIFFIGACYLLFNPSWWLALAVGAVAALTHWTKASILPGVVLVVAVLGLRFLYSSWRAIRQKPEAGHNAINSIAAAVLLPLAFLAGVWPYISKSAEKYQGHYFHNVNSSFYIWLDSWEEAKDFSKKADDRKGWPALPPEEIPSARKFFTEKSPGEIAARLFGGMYEQQKLLKTYGAWKFLLPLLILLGWMMWRAKRVGIEPWLRRHIWTLLFGLLFFGAYFTLVSFYFTIADGARFLFALYGPALAAGVWMVESFARSEQKRLNLTPDPGVTSPQTWVYRLVTFLIILELPLKLAFEMHKEYWGS